MQPEEYVAAIRRHAGRLADAATGNLERPVAACPGWSVADLVTHVGRTHWFWRHIAAGAAAAPDEVPEPRPPAGDDLLPWFRAGAAEMVEVLGTLPSDTAAWTWSERHDVGFIQRRMALETAVHCWDAVAAAGPAEPIPAALAVDGVDEFLDVFVPGRAEHLEGPDETVHLHAGDADGEWVVRTGGGSTEVHRIHGKGDAAVQATASDLLLLLWRRRSPDDVTVLGDRAALDRFLARTDLD